MWLEVKVVISGIGILFLFIVFAYIVLLNPFLGFLIFAAIALIIFSDILIGYQIAHNHLKILMDPCGPDHEIGIIRDLGGNVDFIKTLKDAYNCRNFRKYGQDATIINKGNYQLRFINGNPGFIGHENYPENINLDEAEALQQCEGEDIKEIVKNIGLEKEEKNDRDTHK